MGATRTNAPVVRVPGNVTNPAGYRSGRSALNAGSTRRYRRDSGWSGGSPRLSQSSPWALGSGTGYTLPSDMANRAQRRVTTPDRQATEAKRECQNPLCSKTFTPRNQEHRFCSTTCRKYAWDNRNPFRILEKRFEAIERRLDQLERQG